MIRGADSMQREVLGVVTGMHRGGTTWFGALVQASGIFGVLHEPFNLNHGLRGVPRWYLDPNNGDDRSYWDNAVEEILAGRARHQRPYLKHAKLRSLAKKVVGTGAEKNYRDVILSGKANLIFKDPFLLTFTPELARRGVRCIVVVRHPGAIMQSLERMGWGVDLAELQQRGLIARNRTFDSDVEGVGAYWAALFANAYEAANSKHAANMLFISHERFFDNVEYGVERIARFLGLDKVPESMLNFAIKSTQGSEVQPKNRRVHQINRNSQKLAHSWRTKIAPDKLAALEAEAGPLFTKLDALGR